MPGKQVNPDTWDIINHTDFIHKFRWAHPPARGAMCVFFSCNQQCALQEAAANLCYSCRITFEKQGVREVSAAANASPMASPVEAAIGHTYLPR